MKRTGVSVAAAQSQWVSCAAQTYCGFQPRPRFGNFLFYVGVVFRKLVVLRLAELTAARVFKQSFFLMQILTPTPKPAIAENRTRGRANPDPKTGNCRKPHQGSCDGRRVARIRCEFPHSGSRSGTFPDIWPEDRSTADTACDKKTIISNQNQPTFPVDTSQGIVLN